MSNEDSSYMAGPAFGFDCDAQDDGTDDLTGERIGDYVVGRKIGSGGMGVVFEAQQKHPQRMVALKIIRPGIFSKKMQRRFEVECELLGRLQHPGIAQIHHAGTAKTKHGVRPYFVMELVSGRPLLEYASAANLQVRARIELLARICHAVQHAHTRGVIHRDLKPDNILVDQSGQPKILDFGVARSLDSDAQLTTHRTGVRQLIGTLSYMSPEQVRGRAHDVDARSDVYSLGIIGYRLLSGQFPYIVADTSLPEAARIICEQEPIPLAVRDSRYRGDVTVIVAKAIEKEPERRYQSALAIAEDIDRYFTKRPILARPPSGLYEFRRIVARHKLPFALTGSFFLLTLAFGLWMSALYARTQEAEQLAQERLSATIVARDQAEQETIRANAAGELAESRLVDASQARDDLRVVADFQSAMLSEINAERLGRSIVVDFRVGIQSKLGDRGVKPDQIDAALASFDELAAIVNATDIALQIVDEEILARAVETIGQDFADQPILEAALRYAIGAAYRGLGMYSQSQPQLERALAIRRQELGDDHPDTLTSVAGMGVLLMNLSKYAEALVYSRNALEARRRVLGNEHTDTLQSINNMGRLLDSMGKYDEALPYLREAMDVARRVLGDDDPGTLSSIGNMALLLTAMGKFDEAIPYSHEVVERCRRVLGNDHPDTLTALNNRGVIFYSMGKHTEALRSYHEALEGKRRMLGNDHPDTLVSISNIGSLLLRIGEYDEAWPYYREALAGYRRAFGDDHQSTLTLLSNTGVLFKLMGKYDEAMPYYVEALEGKRRVLGDDHPDTLVSINTMGSLHLAIGNTDEALVFFLEAVEGRRRVLGSDHTATLLSSANVGIALAEQGQLEEAEAIGVKAVEGLRRVLPAGHWRTGAALVAYGKTISLLKRYEKAEEALVEGQSMLEGQFGIAHQRTIKSIEYLVELYEAWHAAEPDAGHDAKAAEWRTKLPLPSNSE